MPRQRIKVLCKYLALALVALSIGGCDGVTKYVATETLAGKPTRSYFFDTLQLTYTENGGSFLSLGAGLPEGIRFALFTVGSAVLLPLVIVYAIRARLSSVSLLGLTMLVAGGASNLANRVLDGRVIDFLNVGVGPVRTGIFNVADMAIMAGASLLVAGAYFQHQTRRHDH